MKKIAEKINAEVFKWHLKFVKKNLPGVTLEIHENIVMQMWRAGISFANINKWLAWRRLKVIKYYCVLVPGQQVRYWTGEVPKASRHECYALGKRIVFVG